MVCVFPAGTMCQYGPVDGGGAGAGPLAVAVARRSAEVPWNSEQSHDPTPGTFHELENCHIQCGWPGSADV